jgi:RNA polymerase sigma-70 factor (ECF subfamily)
VSGEQWGSRPNRATGSCCGPQNKLLESRRRGRVEDRARRRLGLEPEALTDADLQRVDDLAGAEGALALLELLPAGQQAAVRARVIDERGYGEIAEAMRTSELVVRQRVSRGLARLRGAMKAEEER